MGVKRGKFVCSGWNGEDATSLCNVQEELLCIKKTVDKKDLVSALLSRLKNSLACTVVHKVI